MEGTIAGFESEVQAYSDPLTLHLNDDDVYIDNSGEAGIAIADFGFSGAYTHDYGYGSDHCDKHNMWSNPFSVAVCDHAEKDPFGISLPFKKGFTAEATPDDVVFGVSGSKHVIVGWHFSIGINISQVVREMGGI